MHRRRKVLPPKTRSALRVETLFCARSLPAIHFYCFYPLSTSTPGVWRSRSRLPVCMAGLRKGRFYPARERALTCGYLLRHCTKLLAKHYGHFSMRTVCCLLLLRFHTAYAARVLGYVLLLAFTYGAAHRRTGITVLLHAGVFPYRPGAFLRVHLHSPACYCWAHAILLSRSILFSGASIPVTPGWMAWRSLPAPYLPALPLTITTKRH